MRHAAKRNAGADRDDASSEDHDAVPGDKPVDDLHDQWASRLLAAQELLADGDHGAARQLTREILSTVRGSDAASASDVDELLASVSRIERSIRPDPYALIVGAITLVSVLLLLSLTG